MPVFHSVGARITVTKILFSIIPYCEKDPQNRSWYQRTPKTVYPNYIMLHTKIEINQTVGRQDNYDEIRTTELRTGGQWDSNLPSTCCVLPLFWLLTPKWCNTLSPKSIPIFFLLNDTLWYNFRQIYLLIIKPLSWRQHDTIIRFKPMI